MTTMKEFKKAFITAHNWREQRGPNDSRGARHDAERIERVLKARSWVALACAMPLFGRWESAAINRVLPRGL